MNILDTIIAHKKVEVARRKAETPVAQLEKTSGFNREPYSLAQFLLDPRRTGIIAEFKRRSPSKGIINAAADVKKVTAAYADNGASAISVLTDSEFFGGSTADLEAARHNEIPILRKDFIIDEYQLVEARSMGADVILLIAACLSAAAVKDLAKTAQSLGLSVLLELHDEAELGHVNEYTPIVGINNRNLKTFEVDINRSLAMAAQLPSSAIKVAESGIDRIENIKIFKDHGFRGFLIGELFMKSVDPARRFAEFVQEMKTTIG
jgi:indole-3-glycerol phosphate synthase